MAEFYTPALQCFKDNRDKLDPTKDLQTWNLYNGLYQLTKAIQTDLREIQKAVAPCLDKGSRFATAHLIHQ